MEEEQNIRRKKEEKGKRERMISLQWKRSKRVRVGR